MIVNSGRKLLMGLVQLILVCWLMFRVSIKARLQNQFHGWKLYPHSGSAVDVEEKREEDGAHSKLDLTFPNIVILTEVRKNGDCYRIIWCQ